jgi:(1->4)-alpha-D-glucan 1-alpha-D-glucosylmutase
VQQIWHRIDEGLPKLWTIYQALRVRHSHAAAFSENASYEPLQANGTKAEHLLAFTRGDRIAALVPRLVWQLDKKWDDSTVEIPRANWRNVLSSERFAGGTLLLQDLFRSFPVALLVKDE